MNIDIIKTKQLAGADLSRADLVGIDLSEANLTGAELYGADLRGADLRGANLRGADLMYSRLGCADLSEANLTGAELYGADLSGSDLSRANLSGSDLIGSNLHGAKLSGANLSIANLSGADLTGADLRGANLRHTRLVMACLDNIIIDDTTKHFKLACPESSRFIAWKKCRGKLRSGKYQGVLVKLFIPSNAKRSSATSEKCRCDRARVLWIEGDVKTAHSSYDPAFIYETGRTVRVDDFQLHRWCECAPGIHFFMDAENAKNY